MDAPVTEVIAVTDKAARRIAALALKEGRCAARPPGPRDGRRMLRLHL